MASIYPITPIDDTTQKASLPASIVVPRNGTLTVQHYYGNSGEPGFNRLRILAPARHVQTVTAGAAPPAYPGESVEILVDAGEEILVGINGCVGSAGTEGIYPDFDRPSFWNTGANARVHEMDLSHGSWGRYIEWEDLVLSGTNKHFNDSRTLVYFAYPGRQPTVGGLGFGVR